MISIKKVMAGVLVAAMALSFTACSNSKKTEPEASAISKPLTSASPKTSSSPKATATPKATAKPTEKPKATQTPAPTQAPTATPAPTQAPTATPEPTQAPEDSAISEAKDILAYHCAALQGFDDDSYGVEYSYDTIYKGVWENPDEVGVTDPDYLVAEDELTDDMATDDSSFYYHVTSVNSDQEARDSLLVYMSEDVLNQLYGTPLYDYGNTTYIKRDYAGYAPIDRDYDNATITDLTDSSFTATINCYKFSVDNYVGTCTLNMSRSGDVWYLVGYSQNF